MAHSGKTMTFATDLVPQEDNIYSLGKDNLKWVIRGSLPLSDVTGADDLKAIEAISGTTGLLKKTAANTWTLDTNAYLKLSGGTMDGTAQIKWADSGSWGKSDATFPNKRGGLYWTGTSDWIDLFAEETSSDKLNLVVNFGDDANPSFILRDRGADKITMTPGDGSIVATSFSGSGASLTSLNASNLSSGTVPVARLPLATTSAAGAVKIGSGISISDGTISVTAGNLGLSSALRYQGTTTTVMSDGLTTAKVKINNADFTPSAGDVVIYNDAEYLWTGSLWELIGAESSFKKVQTAVSSSSASGSSATTFVSAVTQDTQGVITVKTSTLNTSGTWSGKANTAGTADKISNLVTADQASSSATWRRVWISYSDNVTGRPAWTDNLVFQTSTNTLKTTKFQGALIGNADSATSAGKLTYQPKINTLEELDAFHEASTFKVATLAYIEGHSGTLTRNDGMIISVPWSSSYGHQFYVDDNSYQLHHRFLRPVTVNDVSTPTWADWVQIIDSSNYTSYTVKKDGTGASGTWGISITGSSASCTGNAATATKFKDNAGNTTKVFYRGDNTWSNILKQTAASALGIDTNRKIGTAIKDLHFTVGSGSGTGINDGNAGGITIGTDTSSYGGIYWQSSGSYGLRLHFATTGSFANGAYTRMLITSDGKVGIGTLTPDTLLTVNGNAKADKFIGALQGNADTATSAGKWTTARTLTIGNTGKSVDGSGNVSWSLAEIGAAPAVTGGYLPLSGGTMTGLITLKTNNHYGIKIGNTYITSANVGDVVFQNNSAIRFGTDAWDYNQWAGLKYTHSTKIVSLGIADGSVFTANNAQSGGTLNFPGISNVILTKNVGTIFKYYDTTSTAPVLQINSKDIDATILQIHGNSPSETTVGQSYGFNLKYIGTGGGAGNTLRLTADNSGGTDVVAMEWSGDGKVSIGTTYNSNYRLYVNGTSYLNGATTINGNLIFPNANILDWNSDTYRQRITITDDSTTNTAVFTFQQSTNSGSSYTDLFTIKDNGTVVATTFDGNATSATSAGSATHANYLTGFSSRSTSMGWGNQTGSVITCFATPKGGGWGFRDDNPAAGQVSMTIDGTVYIKEGGVNVGDAIKSISRSGTTFTYTTLWGNTGNFTQQDTNNAATHTVKTTTKYYVTGTETSTTSTGGDTFDTGIYATTTAGQLNATSYKVNEKVTLQWNSTDSSLDFIFA